MKAPNGQRGQGLLTFDTPDCYPDPAAVAYGMPEVFHHGRRVDQTGRSRESVGETVDLEKATYSNTIGASLLSTVWRDPDFDARRSAVYYVRVLEIPTPHWTTYDAVRFGTPRPAGHPGTTQERAYTSPIWYVAR